MDAGFLQPAYGPVYYKDQDDDFVLVTDQHAAWPVCACAGGVLKAWFCCAPPAPKPEAGRRKAEEEEGFEAVKKADACKGPHMHQPPGQQAATLDNA